jgi:hypothetical protein
MTVRSRLGALDIAEAISAHIGSYVDMNFIQFLAVEDRRILCWYMNAEGQGPSFEIELTREFSGWNLHLMEHPPGTEQSVEIP